MTQAERRRDADENKRQRQTDAEAEHQRGAEAEASDLQAQQKHGDRRRTGNESAGQAEQDDLPRRHPAMGETPLNIVRMLALMRVGVNGRIELEKIAFEFFFFSAVRHGGVMRMAVIMRMVVMS